MNQTTKDAKEINTKVNPDAITRLVILMTMLVFCFSFASLASFAVNSFFQD